MGDSFRWCLNCGKMTRWHKYWRSGGHSQCKDCNFPSLWGVKCPDGKTRPDARIIEERESELRYMMCGPRVSGEVYV